MKTKLLITLAAFAAVFSEAAFAETIKPIKMIKHPVDMTTTQSTGPAVGTGTCGNGFMNFKMMKACADAESYPVNALSGMNLN